MPPRKRTTSAAKAKKTTTPSRGRTRGRTRSVSKRARGSRSRTPKPKVKSSSPVPASTTKAMAVAAATTPAKRSPSPRPSQRAGRATQSPSPPVSARASAHATHEVPDLMKPDARKASASSVGSASKLIILGQMLACVAGIYFCFSMWSLKQERLMTMPYYSAGAADTAEGAFFPTVFGVSLAQSFAGFLVAFAIISGDSVIRHVASCVVGHKQPRSSGRMRHADDKPTEVKEESQGVLAILRSLTAGDVRALTVVGFATAFGVTLGYAAMRRLSFPVVLATKMSKMVPVMVVGFVCYGTRYSWRKVASCAMITIGILSFYLMEDHSGKKGHGAKSVSSEAAGDYAWVGFLLLFANLFLDGFANSTQDVLVKRHGWSATTLMLCSNLASALWSLAVMLVLECPCVEATVSALLPTSVVSHFAFGDLSKTAAFLNTYPEARKDLLVMSVLNALGQIFIFQTIALFGTLTLTAMTLVRKAGSVLLSIFVHGHAVSPAQWASLALVMVSVVFEAHVNITETSEKRKKQQQQQQRRKQD